MPRRKKQKPSPPTSPSSPPPLSDLALRAIEVARQEYRSTGWLFSPRTFAGDPQVSARFREVADELARAGYLDKMVSLVIPRPLGEEDEEVNLDAEAAAEAEKCVGTKETFVRPDTGDEILLVPGDLQIWYYTTKKMPVAPPVPDERAFKLHQKFREMRDAIQNLSPGDPDCITSLVLQRQQEAWQAAMDLLAAAFGLPTA